MTVIVEQPEPEQSSDESVALAAGAAVAEVENLAEDVQEIEAVAESAQFEASYAVGELAGVQETLAVIVTQNTELIAVVEGLRNGMMTLAGQFDEVVAKIEESHLPEPEKPKRDTAPRRKSDAHRFLYGGVK